MPERGLSLVEFMVGLAVGLLVVVGAAKLFADFVIGNKRMMLETRVNQDLRAAADMVARDVRRAGYWDNALTGMWSAGTVAPIVNPHATGAGQLSVPSANSVNYSYARDTNDALNAASESAGFDLATVRGVNTLRMKVGGAWQELTDPGTVRITTFSVTPVAPALANDLSPYCGCLTRLTCSLGTGSDGIKNSTFNPAGAPTATIDSLQIVLTGQAVNDPAVVRTLSETVRVRNPRLSGSCPAV